MITIDGSFGEDRGHLGVEEGGDGALFDAVLDIRLDPVLHAGLHARSAMDQRHLDVVAPEVQGGLGGGLLRLLGHLFQRSGPAASRAARPTPCIYVCTSMTG